MKNLLIFVTFLSLILCASGAALGAVHSQNGDFTNWSMGGWSFYSSEAYFNMDSTPDTWYYITPRQNIFRGNLGSSNETTVANLEYILNDQTFAGLSLVDCFSESYTDLRGSYLFDFGLFVSLGYFNSSDDDLAFYTVAPGYRFDLNDQAYLAFSIDYSADDIDFEGISGYDLDFAYYSDTTKFYAQYYIADDEWAEDTDIYELGAAFQAADQIIIGFNYVNVDDVSAYDVGLTWTPDLLTLDLRLGMNLQTDTLYAVSGIFNLTDSFGLGLELFKEDDNANRWMLKLKYRNDNSQLTLCCTLDGEDDYYHSAYNLFYEYSFE